MPEIMPKTFLRHVATESEEGTMVWYILTRLDRAQHVSVCEYRLADIPSYIIECDWWCTLDIVNLCSMLYLHISKVCTGLCICIKTINWITFHAVLGIPYCSTLLDVSQTGCWILPFLVIIQKDFPVPWEEITTVTNSASAVEYLDYFFTILQIFYSRQNVVQSLGMTPFMKRGPLGSGKAIVIIGFSDVGSLQSLCRTLSWASIQKKKFGAENTAKSEIWKEDIKCVSKVLGQLPDSHTSYRVDGRPP